MSVSRHKNDAYNWSDEYSRSERVFRVARAAKNLHRQLMGLRAKIKSTPLFESAVLSANPMDEANLAVNFTHYESPDELEEPELKSLLKNIQPDELAAFLQDVDLKDYDVTTKTDLISFQQRLWANDPKIDKDQMTAAYLNLVALYSRFPVRGYVSQHLNYLHFEKAKEAFFFLVRTKVDSTPFKETIWPCYRDSQGLVETDQNVEERKQNDEGIHEFFKNALLRVVRLQPESTKPEPFNLLAIPIHTLHPSDSQRSYGTFLGWLYLVPSESWEDEPTPGYLNAKALPLIETLWPLLDDFAMSLLDGEMEDRLASFSRSSAQSPLQFVADQIPYISGWKCVNGGENAKVELKSGEHWDAATKTLLISLNQTDDRAQSAVLRLEPKKFTLRDDEHNQLPEALKQFGTKRFCHRIRGFYQQAKLRFDERLNAQSQGSLASKHDYSKDLNSNDIRMDRYERHVKQEREKLHTLIEKTSALETTDAAKSSVVEGLKEVHREYGVPLLDLMALTRYQMMRQKAKDASSLYEEPQFCVERLIDGTKNDVVRVVNLLVWMRSPEWIDPARAPQENGRDFAAWGRIFAYETVANNHLSRIAEHLFHKLGFQLEELDHYFPRPLLRCLVPQDGGERESALTEPFLWPQHKGNPVRPHLFGFFPLFVEAMRAAYLHAYAATLDRVLALGRKQDVPQRAVGVQHPFQQFITLRPTWRLEADGRVRDYRLKISFSGPPSPAAQSIATLPLGDWHSETACFQKLVSQWKASEATEVIAGQQAPAFSITIASH